MDVTAFSGEKFDLKDWINKTFSQPEAQQNKEQYAASLVMKLQLMIAKLNASLEDQSDTIISNLLPRLLREVESLQHETASLQNQMTAVQRDIDQVTCETETSMEQLVKMDRLKTRVQSTVSALKEADNWTTLSTEIEDALDNGDLSLVSSKLSAIQNSLKILSHVQDYDARCVHVDGLKNRLEALSSPQLVSAFNTMDLAKSKFFVKIFADMDRSPELVKYYRKCSRAKLLKAWIQIVEQAEQEMVEETALHWTYKFFDAVIKHVQEQYVWFQEVFPKDQNVVDHMLEILLDVFANLDPKMDFCIEAGLKQNQANPLDYLIQLKKIFNQHLNKLVEILTKEFRSTNVARWRELGKLLHHPFRLYTAKYAQMERNRLQQEMSDISNASKDIIDELKNVSASVTKVVASFENASKRCCDLTEGCAYPALLTAMEVCLTDHYVDRYRGLMRRLEKRKTASHSWTILQQALALNQVSGDLLLSLEQLDINMSIEFLDRTKPFLGSSAHHSSDDDVDLAFEAIQQHHIFLVEPGAELRKLSEFHAKVKLGSSYPIVGDLLKTVTRLCEDLQASTFSILFHPVREQLALVASPATIERVWSSASAGSGSQGTDMPEFSFTPQEYVTQVGQYLMTLPQHLEPYMTHDNPALARALLQERVFPFCSGVSSDSGIAAGTTPADFILSCIACATCQHFQEQILSIPKVTPNSTKQLYVDVGYIGDILEDLGHPLTDSLKSIVTLLKMPPKDFVSGSSGEPQKLVSIIKEMRSLGVRKN